MLLSQYMLYLQLLYRHYILEFDPPTDWREFHILLRADASLEEAGRQVRLKKKRERVCSANIKIRRDSPKLLHILTTNLSQYLSQYLSQSISISIVRFNRLNSLNRKYFIMQLQLIYIHHF